MSKGFASNYRILVIATGLFGVFGILGTRLVWLHVIDRDSFLSNMVKARSQLIVEKSRRGDILDTNGVLLATSHSLIVVGVDPSALRKSGDKLRARDEKLWPQLATLLGLPLSELEKIFTTKFREPAPSITARAASPTAVSAGLVFNLTPPPVATSTELATDDDIDLVALNEAGENSDANSDADAQGRRRIKYVKLAEDISEATYAEIEKLNIQGIVGDRVYRRAYPNQQLASQVIGFVNREEKPVTGLERFAEFYLRGQDGWREGERDGRRRELAQFRTREVQSANGYSLQLTLDANVQDIVEKELATIAQKYEPQKATIIVSDPRAPASSSASATIRPSIRTLTARFRPTNLRD